MGHPVGFNVKEIIVMISSDVFLRVAFLFSKVSFTLELIDRGDLSYISLAFVNAQ